ncbi:hypothetical protein V6N13_063715 [Hibiscus sabdariffa]
MSGKGTDFYNSYLFTFMEGSESYMATSSDEYSVEVLGFSLGCRYGIRTWLMALGRAVVPVTPLGAITYSGDERPTIMVSE